MLFQSVDFFQSALPAFEHDIHKCCPVCDSGNVTTDFDVFGLFKPGFEPHPPFMRRINKMKHIDHDLA